MFEIQYFYLEHSHRVNLIKLIIGFGADSFYQTIDGSDSSYLISDTCGNNLIGQTLMVQDGNECYSPVVSNPIEIYCNPDVTISSNDVCEGDISSFIGISQFGTSQQITFIHLELRW